MFCGNNRITQFLREFIKYFWPYKESYSFYLLFILKCFEWRLLVKDCILKIEKLRGELFFIQLFHFVDTRIFIEYKKSPKKRD